MPSILRPGRPTGAYIAYDELTGETGIDLWTVAREGDPQAEPFLKTRSNESGTMFSPNNQKLIVRHQSTAEFRSFLEVLTIRSIFRESIDSSNNVPACSSKSFHEIPMDVIVGVEREATSHALT